MKSQDIVTKTTESIIAMLESGVAPWRKPWTAQGMPVNAVTQRPYRGVNVFILWAVEATRGYTGGGWLTFNQAKALGGSVRKGEKGTAIVFWKIFRTQDRETRDEVNIPLLRYYTVFHTSQCENLPVKPTVETTHVVEPVEAAEALVAQYFDKPSIGFGGGSAYYAPSRDHVQMPERDTFKSAAGYYNTLFHELAHSTGHESRLNRRELANVVRFGDEAYSTEELTAELTAAFCCVSVGLDQSTLPQSASYIKSWLSALKADPKMLITAAARAQRAYDYMTKTTVAESGDDE